ncbi:FAD-dependent monooxygenase [Streptomyces xiamenensis]
MRRLRTQVGIIGAGPAGLVLANVLGRAGIDCQVVERHPRARVESRARAGLLEERTVAYLRAHGLADRLLAEGTRHGWCEFLCQGQRLRMDYAALTGGARHWVYPQQWLVRDLIAALETDGRLPWFATPARAVEELRRIRCDRLQIDCDYVIGCDGGHGVSRHALHPVLRREVTQRYPYDWLAVLAEVDTPAHGVLYALHERGFAGMMPRTPAISRFYLQCAAGDTPADWPERRVREELRLRLEGGPALGGLYERRTLRMHSRVTRPLQHGPLFLAGDAAHLLTPSGAKGMNLAIDDAADLAHALLHGGLAGYGQRRLAALRRAQDFSERLMRLLHRPPRDALEELRRLTRPGPEAAAFAREFVGHVNRKEWRA